MTPPETPRSPPRPKSPTKQLQRLQQQLEQEQQQKKQPRHQQQEQQAQQTQPTMPRPPKLPGDLLQQPPTTPRSSRRPGSKPATPRQQQSQTPGNQAAVTKVVHTHTPVKGAAPPSGTNGSARLAWGPNGGDTEKEKVAITSITDPNIGVVQGFQFTVATEANINTEIRTKLFRMGAPLLRSTIPVVVGDRHPTEAQALAAARNRKSREGGGCDSGSDAEPVMSDSDIGIDDLSGLSVTFDFAV